MGSMRFVFPFKQTLCANKEMQITESLNHRTKRLTRWEWSGGRRCPPWASWSPALPSTGSVCLSFRTGLRLPLSERRQKCKEKKWAHRNLRWWLCSSRKSWKLCLDCCGYATDGSSLKSHSHCIRPQRLSTWWVLRSQCTSTDSWGTELRFSAQCRCSHCCSSQLWMLRSVCRLCWLWLILLWRHPLPECHYVRFLFVLIAETPKWTSLRNRHLCVKNGTFSLVRSLYAAQRLQCWVCRFVLCKSVDHMFWVHNSFPHNIPSVARTISTMFRRGFFSLCTLRVHCLHLCSRKSTLMVLSELFLDKQHMLSRIPHLLFGSALLQLCFPFAFWVYTVLHCFWRCSSNCFFCSFVRILSFEFIIESLEPYLSTNRIIINS